MKRHHGRLAHPEDVQDEDRAEHSRRSRAGQDPTRHELDRARELPRPDDRQELEAHRRREQDAQVDPPGLPGLLRLVVGDQRERAQREDLVEREEREEVGAERDAQRPRDRDGEEEEEAGLVLLVVPAHVADRVERRDRPEEGGDEREDETQGLDLEGERHAGHDLEDVEARRLTRAHPTEQPEDRQEGQDAPRERRPLAHVGAVPQDEHHDGRDDGHEQRHRDQHDGAHPPPPRSDWAALVATFAVKLASMPK